MKKIFIILIFIPLISLAGEVETDKLRQEIADLKRRLLQLEQLVDKQVVVAKEPKEKIEIKQEHAVSLDKKNDNSYDNSVKIGGFLSTEFASYTSKGDNESINSNIRNARINVKGKASQDLSYFLEADFAVSDVTKQLKKLYIDYSAFDPVFLRIGRFTQDFGTMTSDLLPERNPIFCLAKFNEDGVRLSTHGDNWYSSVAITSNNYDSKSEAKDSKSFFLRTSYAPIYEGRRVVHTGASYAKHLPNSSNTEIAIKQGFENQFLDRAVNIVKDDNNINNINYMDSYGLDLGYLDGPFSVQSEFVESKLSTKTYNSNYFNGGYVQVAYTLTGEQRGYDAKSNRFAYITPREDFNIQDKTYGAWELAFRYSIVDLNGQSIKGGRMANYASSLNWYLNKNTSLMFTYIKGTSDKYSVIPYNNPNIFLIRANLLF